MAPRPAAATTTATRRSRPARSRTPSLLRAVSSALSWWPTRRAGDPRRASAAGSPNPHGPVRRRAERASAWLVKPISAGEVGDNPSGLPPHGQPGLVVDGVVDAGP